MWRSRLDEIPQDILSEILFQIPPYELYPKCTVDDNFNRICDDPYFKRRYENYWIQQKSDHLPLLITPDNFSNITSLFQGGLGQRPKDVSIDDDDGTPMELSKEELKILNQPINFPQAYLKILIPADRNENYYNIVTIPSTGVSIATILNIIADFYEIPLTWEYLDEMGPKYRKSIISNYHPDLNKELDPKIFKRRDLLAERFYDGISYLGSDPENPDVAIIKQEID